MAEFRVLNAFIDWKNDWRDICSSISFDALIAAFNVFIDISDSTAHLHLPNGEVAAIICLNRTTLMDIYRKVGAMSDNDFQNSIDDDLLIEEEIPTRSQFHTLLRELTASTSDLIILQYII